MSKDLALGESEQLCNEKTRSAVPPENSCITENLKHIVDMVAQNTRKLDNDTHATFSTNGTKEGNHYVEFVECTKKGDKHCEIFYTKETEAYKKKQTNPI